MVIVQFGKRYAIRKGFFPFYRYKDLRSSSFWWGRGSEYFSHCLSSNLEELREQYAMSEPHYGKVVK